MVIAKYIGDLLFDYECVVIPGLGGFIINDKPAEISYDTHYFKPPFREVMFNPYLRTNDGLLLNYVAKEENLTYQQAKQKVDAFTHACHNALNSGKQIRFDKVGIIRKENDKIVFIQDKSVNYNPESFGLSPFISPAVRRITEEEKIKEVIKKVTKSKKEKEQPADIPEKELKRKDRKVVTKTRETSIHNQKQVVVPKRRSTYRFQFLFILLLLVGMMAGWGVMNKNIVKSYYAQYKSKVPMFYSNPGSYLANNVEIIPLQEIGKSTSALWLVQLFKDDKNNKKVSLAGDDLTFKEEPAENKKAKNNEEEVPEVEQTVTVDNTAETNQPEETLTETTSDNDNFTTTYISEDEATAEETKETVNPVNSEVEEEVAEPVQEPRQELKPEESLHYFIIAGSFEKERNALRLLNQLKTKGYNAVTAGTNKYGMTRVAYGAYATMQEATGRLSVIRNQDNPSAWILKK